MILKCLVFLSVWSVLDAQFTVDSCQTRRLTHGRVRSWQRKRLIKYSCFMGYDLVGERYSSCINGRWDTPLPVCVKYSRSNCPLPKVDNGYIVSSRQGAWLMFFCLPHHELVGSQEIYCDGRQWNDTAPTCVESSAPVKLSCDFESPDLCGWTQDAFHDFDWVRFNKKTPSSFLFTGPSYDHTYGEKQSGYYMYIESTSRLENDTARLMSPIYDASLVKDGCFTFYYHMFGRSIGGLRVYQKPDNIPLQTLLQLNAGDKKKFILFEQWGSQGDAWYGEVAALRDFSDDFQIIIEGIRGASFTSDIAIDDVAILQGENCTIAKRETSTASTFLPESCEGRCSINLNETQLGCGCNMLCFVRESCCPDFFDICINNLDSTLEENNQSAAELPQTEKLVKSTTAIPLPTTLVTWVKYITTSIKMSTISTPRQTITPKATTTTKTTPNITTKSTKQTTFQKELFNTTTARIKIKTTTTTSTTTVQSTPTLKTTKTTPAIIRAFNRTTVPTKQTTKVILTRLTLPTTNALVVDVRKKSKLETKKEDQLIGENPGSSAWKPVLITVAVLLCCVSLAWVLIGSKGARGRAALDYIRGRTTNDPEVRYLHSNEDDDSNY